MITFENATGSTATRDTGLLSLPATVSGSGSAIDDRRYAVFAKVETGIYKTLSTTSLE